MDFNKTFNFEEMTPLEDLLKLEWIETNGLGGWASSTVCGANTRRYHGVLVASLEPPVKRVVFLSRLDETVVVGDVGYPLATRIYSGAVHPDGYHTLRKFERQLFPTTHYELKTEKGVVSLKKSIIVPHGQNTTIIRYELLDGPESVTLQLEPFIAARDYHSLTHANDVIDRPVIDSEDSLSFKPYSTLPSLQIVAKGMTYKAEPCWYYHFEYQKEIERGLDCHEDLFRIGFISKTLKKGEVFDVLATIEEGHLQTPKDLIDRETKRKQSLLKKAVHRDFFVDTLVLAADQFIVNRGENSKTVIAGYHWFTDWGRDTMIALPGLCIATGRPEEAKKILETFSKYVSEGMIPNRFPDGGDVPEYNTVDATLWYFVALYHYYIETEDVKFVKNIYKVLQDIISWHDRGTRYGIKVDSDGLLFSGEASVQLTWMDAKIGDWIVTPRTGKAVEINALWHNALAITATFASILGDEGEARSLFSRADSVAKTFEKMFWNESLQCLYDVINGDVKDASIRPNQLIALSLPFEIISSPKAKKILECVESQLLTPFGLRSLSPTDPHYIGHYLGDQYQRDAAYHQGTVWSWLLGPYITAVIRYRQEKGRKQAKELFGNFQQHLSDAGIDTISEIFDGDAPHTPRGCIAQAWGVAEILRAYLTGCK